MSNNYSSPVDPGDVEQLSTDLDHLHKTGGVILSDLQSAVLGQEDMLTELLIGLIAGGHLLL